MSNDEESDINSEAEKEALTELEIRQSLSAMNNVNNKSSPISQSFKPGSNNIISVSHDRDSFLRSAQNQSLSRENDKNYAYVVGKSRRPNDVEKFLLNLQFGEKSSDNYCYVKYRANNTPSDAIPAFGLGIPTAMTLIENMLPEALFNKTKFEGQKDLPEGTFIVIEFLDKKNNASAIVTEIAGNQFAIPLTSSGFKSPRNAFAEGHIGPISLPSNISKAAFTVGSIIYDNMSGRKGNKACEFLKTWEQNYATKYVSARQSWTNRKFSAIESAVNSASSQWSLDPEILRTFAFIESGFDPYAINSSSGAAGLYQILPHLTLDGRRKIYQIHKVDLTDPLKSAIAVGRKLRENRDKIENESYPQLKIKKLQPWQFYVTHNQGVDGFAVQHTACKLFNEKGEKEELILAAQYLFDSGYGPIMTNGRNYFPKVKSKETP
jgi:hypothetical protein